jgi:hypothetical protein
MCVSISEKARWISGVVPKIILQRIISLGTMMHITVSVDVFTHYIKLSFCYSVADPNLTTWTSVSTRPKNSAYDGC